MSKDSCPKFKSGDMVVANEKVFPRSLAGKIYTINNTHYDTDVGYFYCVNETLINFFGYELEPFEQINTKLGSLW